MFLNFLNFICHIPDYGNEYMKKENKNLTNIKIFAPKLN